MRHPYSLILVFLLAFSAAPAAIADNGSESDFDREQLETFLQARADVLDIQQEYSNRLQSAEDDQEVADLQSEAREEMVTAVEDAGMTVEEFNRIAQAAQNDPDVAEELQSLAE